MLIMSGTGCERRQQIIAEGDFTDADSSVYHWKEYMDRDSFFREVTSQGKIVSVGKSKTQEAFRDSTFSETDFYTNGKQKASRNFVKGSQQGVWKSWYEDGKTKSASVVDAGVLRDYLSYYDDGSIAVTASKATDGTMSRTDRWRNGNLKEEFITDSLGNGKCTNYYENGKKQQEGTLFRFTPSGNWLRWDSLGNSLSDTTYGQPVTF
jgi:antitoxin component YwqK of YwqJK toxin-antitoxin module